MKFFSNISKRSLYSFILLAPFLGIYLIDFTCTIVNATHHIQLFSKSDDHHSHNHGDGHNHQHEHHHGDKGDDSNKDDNCCKDITLAFFSSVQFQPKQISFNFSLTDFTIIKQLCLIFFFDYYHFVPDTRPPPLRQKIPDIRVFIQSFLI